MQIGSEDEFIVIDQIDSRSVESDSLEDVQVHVQIKLKEFSGVYDSVTISKSDIEQFIRGLEQLEQKRTSEIVLNSFNPNEFLLTISSKEKRNNLAVAISLSRYQYSGPVEWNTSISGGFELGSDSVPSLLNSFKGLIQLH